MKIDGPSVLARWTAGRPEVVLLATDWSARGDRPLDRAIQLAHYWDALLVVLIVVEVPVPDEDRVGIESQIKGRIFDEMPSRAVRFHIDVAHGDVAEAVLKVAAEKRADLIVMGVAHRDQVGEFVLGTAVDRLVRTSNIPVLVVKARPRNGYARIMVATDYSPCSAHALNLLPAFPRAEVMLVHARFPRLEEMLSPAPGGEPFPDEELSEREAFLATIGPATRKRLRPLTVVGLPPAALVACVREHHHDVAFVDRHGHGGVRRALIGSTAEKLLSVLPCDVMIVPEPTPSTVRAADESGAPAR